MSSRYEFILDNKVFSHSSLSTYDNCPYAFYLTYIADKPRVNNFFAEYGLLTHQAFEEYFNGNLESYELSKFYRDNYYVFCVTPPPPYPSGMEENYKREGQEFFDNFSFDKSRYEVLGVEDTLKFEIWERPFSGRPDIILRDRETDENILTDVKTSKAFRKSKTTDYVYKDDKKLAGYYRQMHLYTYGIRETLGINIDKIMIWFTRPEKRHVIKWSKKTEEKTLKWAEDTLKKIYSDEEFVYDNSQEYFCQNICGVRESCPYKKD